MSEIKEQKPQGMMSKQTENEETSFMSRIIPDPEERRAAGQLVRKALTGFSTFIGNTAEQYGGLLEEKEIDDAELNAAIKAGEQQLKVVDEENEVRAKRLQKITDRGKGFQEEGSLLMSDPMFKLAMKKYTQKTGKTIDLTDPNLKRNLGKRFVKNKKDFNQKTAVATIVNEIYNASEDPEISLFEKEFKTPLTVKVKKPIDSQMAQLKQPTGVFGSIEARRPPNVVKRVTREGSKLTDFVDEPEVTSTSETFSVMDPSSVFRVKREVHSKIASANKLKLSYSDERSDKPIFKEGTGNKTNDLAYAKAATELVDFVVDAGYGEEDSDKVFRDVLLIVQNAAPRKDDSQQEQNDLNSKVAQIKSKLALMDNRFEKRRLIEQLKKGEGLPKEEKRVVDNTSLVLSLMGITSEDNDISDVTEKVHESNPNIQKINDSTFEITVKNGNDQYPAGTVLQLNIARGQLTDIKKLGTKDVVPSTYEEWKALPEETPQQQKAKRRFMNTIPEIRARVIEENRKNKDQQ